jgi:signal transduction histidine kinase/ActR/RegA family two-component response regulator
MELSVCASMDTLEPPSRSPAYDAIGNEAFAIVAARTESQPGVSPTGGAVPGSEPESPEILKTALQSTERRQTESEQTDSENDDTLKIQLTSELDAMRKLQELNMRLVESTTLDAIFVEVVHASIELQRAHFGTLHLYEPAEERLSIVALRGFDSEFAERFRIVHANDGSVCGRALQTRSPVVVSDLESDPVFGRHIDVTRRAGIRAVISRPILGRTGQPLGVVSAQYREPIEQPSERDLRMIELYIRLAGVVIERRQQEKALHDADRRKDEFLATLAHELRNPLAPIRNAVQLMRIKNDPDPTLRKVRDIIERQVGHMARLVDDLLELSRITRGRVDLQRRRIDLRDVITLAAEASRAATDAAGHTLTIDMPSEAVYVDGDATRLSQVFSNLLNNAAKYTRSGGRIDVRIERGEAEVCVRIVDTGIGIPKHMLGRIFDMFTQVDSSLERAQGGLGIGLTLVRELVQLHGGRIVAESDGIGAGSTFTVYLPHVSQASGADSAKSSADEGESAQPLSSSRKVLVADDNLDAADSLAVILSTAGHEVRTVYNGPDAVRIATEFEPDAIFLDLGMPGMNGYEAARRIRALPSGRNAFMAALTGWGQAQDRLRSSEAGFDEHLTKPIDLDALLSTLGALRKRSD